jgi:hypothetical protein
MSNQNAVREIFERMGHLNIPEREVMKNFADQAYSPEAKAIVATTGGGTTGLIDPETSFGVITSDSANKQVSLPAASIGKRIELFIGANGCEMISSVAAHKVNNVVVGATNEAALPANSHIICTYVAANTWLVTGYNNLGVAITIVPDIL